MNRIKPVYLKFAGAIVGLAAGLLYYYRVGCINGCAIWSNIYTASGYGLLLGYLAVSMFVAGKKDAESHDPS